VSSDKPQRQILAIDDDADILDIIRICLESAGFKVHTATDPAAGLNLYRQLSREIDLVLLDYVMPGMTGDRVFESLRQINPAARVLLLTACDDNVARTMFADGLRGYVQKPFYLNQLVKQVQETIEASP
jgi:CheY-like chemotaxis protein